MANSTKAARLLDRGLTVLTVIGEQNGTATFRDLTDATGLPKATLSRILASLRKFGLVVRDETDRYYKLGPGYTHLLAASKIDQTALRAQDAELQRLSDELEEPVFYWLVARDMISALRRYAPFHARSDAIDPAPARLDQAAPGVAVLAAMDSAQLTKVLRRFETQGPRPTENVGLLLGFSAATGYALRPVEPVQTGDPARVEVAAAITNAKAVPVAAISILCDTDRISETERHQFGRRLAFVARNLSEDLGRAPRRRDVALRRPARLDVATGDHAITCLDDRHLDQVGSAPFWDADGQRLVWIDSLGGAVNWAKPGGARAGRAERIAVPDLPGAAAPYGSTRLLLASREGVSIMKLPGGGRTFVNHPEPDEALRRFSTAALGADGQAWLGTLSPVPAAGAGQGRLYRIGFDGKIRRMLELDRGIKGLCWSPDGAYLYLTEAGSKAILRFEIDEKSQRPIRPRRFAIHREDGTPNGLAMDREGHVWAAIYGGWCLKRFDTTGREVARIALPVPLPTALCFGGPRRSQIFTTTCRLHVPPEVLIDAPLSGTVLSIDAGVSGAETPQFSLKMR